MRGAMKSREMSPLRILLLVLLIVFAAESAVMLVLAALPPGFPWLGESVLDATMLAIVSSPFLYWFVIKPFRMTATTESTNFSNLLEAAPEGILGVAEDGRIRFVNAQAETLFGYSREQLLGQPVESLIPQRFADGHDKKRETYLRAPRTRPMAARAEIYGRKKDGTEFPADVSLSYVETPEGSLVVSIMRDITDRKHYV